VHDLDYVGAGRFADLDDDVGALMLLPSATTAFSFTNSFCQLE
jgi:hypothetical protein